MTTLPTLTPDLSEDVDAVLHWLADKNGGQAEFSIGEHWAGYPTEVCDGRIALAADILSDAVAAGCGADFNIPGGVAVTRATMDGVFAEIRARAERARKVKEERAARKVADEAQRVLDIRRAEQRARREDQLRRMMDPTNNAAPAEREMARRQLEGL